MENTRLSRKVLKGGMLGNFGNDNNFSSSSSITFKVEAKLEIPTFDG
jgi:hypothetical protein